jgi:hypothetical protein
MVTSRRWDSQAAVKLVVKLVVKPVVDQAVKPMVKSVGGQTCGWSNLWVVTP